MAIKRLPIASPGLKNTLDRVVATTDRGARLQADPASVMRAFDDPREAELVGLLASCMALGSAATARDKSREVLSRLPTPLLGALDRPWAQTAAELIGWKHRFYGPEPVARLLTGARRVQVRHGMLGRRFGALLVERGELEGAVEGLVEEIQREGWGEQPLDQASQHLLPVPTRGGSASKRLMLYLRWMVRPDDGVDRGLWGAWVNPSSLVMPVDVHILRLAQNVGLTSERTASWRAAREITRKLAEFRPDDPVGYDFALCHLGMVQGCPSRAEEGLCAGCGVRPVCVHWQGVTSGARAKRLRRG